MLCFAFLCFALLRFTLLRFHLAWYCLALLPIAAYFLVYRGWLIVPTLLRFKPPPFSVPRSTLVSSSFLVPRSLLRLWSVVAASVGLVGWASSPGLVAQNRASVEAPWTVRHFRATQQRRRRAAMSRAGGKNKE
ncbi:hypothetical protein BZA77DRAFT_328940 [Pyronema omphalodes]|nr:hypothetical protein BZA77DRAFT_328940 [Pyronema omphalodes]